MIPSQLFQTLLGGSNVSADQQVATPDDGGSYGELMDAIDLAIEQAELELAEVSVRRKAGSAPRDKAKRSRQRKAPARRRAAEAEAGKSSSASS